MQDFSCHGFFKHLSMRTRIRYGVAWKNEPGVEVGKEILMHNIMVFVCMLTEEAEGCIKWLLSCLYRVCKSTEGQWLHYWQTGVSIQQVELSCSQD